MGIALSPLSELFGSAYLRSSLHTHLLLVHWKAHRLLHDGKLSQKWHSGGLSLILELAEENKVMKIDSYQIKYIHLL